MMGALKSAAIPRGIKLTKAQGTSIENKEPPEKPFQNQLLLFCHSQRVSKGSFERMIDANLSSLVVSRVLCSVEKKKTGPSE
jgi:hypothetical protein